MFHVEHPLRSIQSFANRGPLLVDAYEDHGCDGCCGHEDLGHVVVEKLVVERKRIVGLETAIHPMNVVLLGNHVHQSLPAKAHLQWMIGATNGEVLITKDVLGYSRCRNGYKQNFGQVTFGDSKAGETVTQYRYPLFHVEHLAANGANEDC